MPSRRELIELTDDEIRAYMDSHKTLIIISNGRDGFPHPMPMWFYVDAAGCVYCTTFRKSQKVLNFRRDPKAALLVESGAEYAGLKSVMIHAQTEIIDDFDVVCDTSVQINTRGRVVDAAEVALLREGVAKMAAKRVVLKFKPQQYVSWDHTKLGGKY